uniref:Uncharacterized protein n=1 Tax=Arundo donax TaxID=35708 RepID=A0A0A9GY14_ARUDO
MRSCSRERSGCWAYGHRQGPLVVVFFISINFIVHGHPSPSVLCLG